MSDELHQGNALVLSHLAKEDTALTIVRTSLKHTYNCPTCSLWPGCWAASEETRLTRLIKKMFVGTLHSLWSAAFGSAFYALFPSYRNVPPSVYPAAYSFEFLPCGITQ
jgi:hypothetical protein